MHDCRDARPHRIALLLRFVGIAFGITTQAHFPNNCLQPVFVFAQWCQYARKQLGNDRLLVGTSIRRSSQRFAFASHPIVYHQISARATLWMPVLSGHMPATVTDVCLLEVFTNPRLGFEGLVPACRVHGFLCVLGNAILRIEAGGAGVSVRLDSMVILASSRTVAAPSVRGTQHLSLDAASRVHEFSGPDLVYPANDRRSRRPHRNLDRVCVRR